jgi:hypothetical protein
MKKAFGLTVSLFGILLIGCLGSPSVTSRGSEPPRREFQSIAASAFPSYEPSIVNDFLVDDSSFGIGSIYFSTALFLADANILMNTSKELFEKYASVLFSQFPREGEVKEIIIPDLSLSHKEGQERDAYLFITKNKTNEEQDYYLIETNIPIGSIYASTYDGYVMRLEDGFYKDKIPARWTSIMNIRTNNDIILYRGIAYPSKSAPLIFTGTGIGSDIRMNAIMSRQTTIAEISNNLKSTVEQTFQNTTIENQQKSDSMKFLEKSTYLSLAAYSYIDSNVEDAKKYLLLSNGIEVDIPDDIMGSRYKELYKIIDYLLSVIDQ